MECGRCCRQAVSLDHIMLEEIPWSVENARYVLEHCLMEDKHQTI